MHLLDFEAISAIYQLINGIYRPDFERAIKFANKVFLPDSFSETSCWIQKLFLDIWYHRIPQESVHVFDLQAVKMGRSIRNNALLEEAAGYSVEDQLKVTYSSQNQLSFFF